MMGDLSNWTYTIGDLARHHYRVLVPVLPVYDMPMSQTSVSGLVDYVSSFLDALGIDRVVVAGNSLGGHIALLFALNYPESIEAMLLSGASGIYEVDMGTSTMRRQDREFIRSRAAVTFFDPAHATDDLVDEVFEIVNNRARALRLIKMARSVKAESVTEHLSSIEAPTLLIWGREDTITPPDVAYMFQRLIPQAELHFIDECGHAPMIEHPGLFNRYTLDFLRRAVGVPTLASS
jgi:pimeloyl-ACP methyl ester carboxylesterase